MSENTVIQLRDLCHLVHRERLMMIHRPESISDGAVNEK